MQWTTARRKRQAAIIRELQPWRSGGVKTPEGKQISRYNAVKHGMRSKEMMELSRLLTRCDHILTEIQQFIILSAKNDDYGRITLSPVGG